eukprot:4434091-Amphidinium_carterae.1
MSSLACGHHMGSISCQCSQSALSTAQCPPTPQRCHCGRLLHGPRLTADMQHNARHNLDAHGKLAPTLAFSRAEQHALVFLTS